MVVIVSATISMFFFFLPKVIIFLGCEMGVPPFKENTHIPPKMASFKGFIGKKLRRFAGSLDLGSLDTTN